MKSMFKKDACTLSREQVEEKAQALLEQMTLKEKVWMLNGNWDPIDNFQKHENMYNPTPIKTTGCPRLGVSPIGFSDGPTEDIITKLSGFPRLRVASRNSTIRYKDSPRNVREVGHQLQVSAVLQGNVRREGNRVRITAQLVDVRSDSNLWAETYDREFKDTFEIQYEIAQSIASALNLTPGPERRSGAFRGPSGLSDP